MSDNLNIQIDTARAQQALDSLGTAADRLLNKLGQLNGTTNLDKVVQSLTKLDTASANVSGDGFDKLQAAINKLDAAKIAAAAQQLQGLGSLNLGSTVSGVTQLQNAINGINPTNLGSTTQAVGGAGAAAKKSSSDFDSFATAIRNANGQVLGLTANAATMAGAFSRVGGDVGALVKQLSVMLNVSKGVAAGMLAFGAIVVFKQLAQQAAELAQAIAEPAVQIDRFKSSIDAIAGAGAGAKAFAELNKITKQVGGNIGQMLDPFQKFVIAAKSAGVEMQTSVNVFRGFQTGLTATGASAQQTERVFNALQQMMAKGTVQAEELKGQLGDSLPGALDIAAKSMGVTTKELLKLVESGRVMAVDLLPKMAREMENTFGAAARARMQGFTGQLDALRNNFFSLTAALGQGALGGALAGFANFMKQINAAMTMPGMENFVRLLGDLLGGLTAIAGALLGGVLQGFASLAGALGNIYGLLTGGLSALKEWVDSFGVAGQYVTGFVSGLTGLIPTMITTATATTTVALALKALKAAGLSTAGVWGVVAVGAVAFITSLESVQKATAGAVSVLKEFVNDLTTFGTPVNAAAIGVTALLATFVPFGAVLGGARAAVVMFGGALKSLWTIMYANPLIALVGGVTALVVSLKQFGVLDSVTEKFNRISAATIAARTETEAATEAFARLSTRVAAGADVVYAAATKFATYDEMAKRAKQTMHELEKQQEANNAATAEQGRQLKEHEMREKSYQDSIKASSEALKYRIDREKEAKASAQELGKIVEQQDRLNAASTAQTKASADGMSKVRDALKQNTVEYDIHGNAIARLNSKIKENDAAMKASEASMTAVKARHEEMTIATQRSEAEIKRMQSSVKEYGIILDESQQKLVSIVERTGKYKEEAATLAVQISNLTRSQDEWNTKINENIAANDRKIAAEKELVAMMEVELNRLNEKSKTQKGLTDLEKVQRDALTAGVAARKQSIDAMTDENLIQETFNRSMREGIDTTVAAKKVIDEHRDALNRTVDAQKIADGAVKKMTETTTGNTDKTKEAADAAKQASEASKKQAEEQKKVADQMGASTPTISSVSEAWTKLSTSLGGVTNALAPIETQLQSAAAAVVSMGQNIGAISTNLPQVAEGFAGMKEPLAAIAPTLEPLTAAFNAMGAAVPVIAPGLTTVRDAFLGMQQTLPPLVEPFGSLRTAVDAMSLSITPVAEGFASMGQSFPLLAAAGTQVSQAFTAIGGTVDKVKELPGAVTAMSTSIDTLQVASEKMTERASLLNEKLVAINETFTKSKEATDAFVDNMKSVDSAINSTIEKLDALIEKARAAQRELANTNGGGGGGDKITAGSQRYGGYSGGGIESSVVSASAFDNAPRLAQGIANTNSLTKRAEGGIPTILHPNEAVVPLPKGRSIPVDMRVDGASQLSMAVQNAERTLNDLADMSMPEVRAPDRASYVSPLEATGGRGAVGAGGKGATPLKESAAVEDGRMARSKRFNAGAVDPAVSSTGGAPISVNITVNAKDADSFKRSQGQIQSDLFRAISRQAAKDR